MRDAVQTVMARYPFLHPLGAGRGRAVDTFGNTDAHLGPSIFAVRSETLFDEMYLTGLLVSITFLAGWRTRLIAFPFVVLFTWSLQPQPLMMNGANRLVAVTLLNLLFLDSSAHLHRRPAAARKV